MSRRRNELKDHPDQFHARIRSDPSELAGIRKTFEAFLSADGFDAKSVDETGLVLNEALANIIRHAYSNRVDEAIEIVAASDSDGVMIEIRDWGNGVVPCITDIECKDPQIPGGLGLPCMKKMMTTIEFIPQSDGMLLKLYRAKSMSRT